jgi:hypothetical protein
MKTLLIHRRSMRLRRTLSRASALTGLATAAFAAAPA